MGLKVTKNMNVFEGKSLIGYSFYPGGEAVLDLEDKEGQIHRVRISASLRDILETFKGME